MAPQLSAFDALSHDHKLFVRAYITHGCDAAMACQDLHPEDDRETNVRRGWKLMQRPDIKAALNEKLDQQQGKLTLTRDDMARKILSLMNSTKSIDDADQKISVKKFHLACIAELNRILGFHHLTVNHTQQQDIKISLVGIKKPEAPATNIQDAQVIPNDPVPTNQLDISFPPADPVHYDLSDLDDISEELPPEDPDLP